jgi:hypothetical protein
MIVALWPVTTGSCDRPIRRAIFSFASALQ